MLPPALAEAFRKPVSLEFRDAPLRSVFESLARGHGLNVVFDRDVRTDTRITLFLRQTTLAEALRLVLGTQQLAQRVLNANTLLVYPDTPAKQRQHQELVTRTLYLTNADPKGIVTLIRTIAKTQDIHLDERLNAVVVRDTPAVVRLIEDLVATVDLPEPEVMLELEVLEVASSHLAALGLQWPEQVDIGLVDAAGNTTPDRIVIGRGLNLRASIANPGLVATLRGTYGSTHTLANPTIRARNREKAQVHVGEKLPVFTTTSAANVGVSASVSYLDVGIKLDVQPVVQLDNEVSIKVELEVSNLIREVSGPAGSVGYQIGTRRASTALRLRDGETQVLAGLLNDEERRTANGLPGLSKLPLLGRLFGVQGDSGSQTEVVLLITPRVVRNITPPAPHLTLRAAGTAADPGAPPLRLGAGARATLPAPTGAAAARRPAEPGAEPAPATTASPAAAETVLRLSSGGAVSPGGTVAVTLDNSGEFTVTGSVSFDATLLANAAAGADDAASVAFEIAPRGQFALVLRARPGAEPGRQTEVRVDGLAARAADGSAATVTLAGEARIEVRRAP
jgi:general secretion pathway protein D